MERLKYTAEQILGRVDYVTGKGEQATRQAMILPLLESLGYDIWNPAEVCPEFGADTAIKKAGQKEKVDYAILLDGAPRIFFEVKPLGYDLDGHNGQLARYFNSTTSVTLSVLTDGLEYRFYTDTGEPNIQDPQPFFVTRLDAPEPRFEVLMKFHKTRFSPEAIGDYATELTYTARLETFLRDELDLRSREPSEDFVRWVLGNTSVWDGRTTSGVVERFKPIVRQSLQRVIKQIVRRSLAAIDDGLSGPAPDDDEPQVDAAVPTTEAPAPAIASADDALPEGVVFQDGNITTTVREIRCFDIVCEQFGRLPEETRVVFDPTARRIVSAEVGYKDTSSYFGIYLNKPGWWVVRVVIESRNPYVVFRLDPEVVRPLLPDGYSLLDSNSLGASRIGIDSPEDLVKLEAVTVAALEAMFHGG